MPTNNRPVRSHSRRGDYGKPLARECEGFQKRESGASSFVCRQHGTAPKVSWAPNSFLETFFGHPIKLIGSSERRKRGKADTSHRVYRPHERHLTFYKLFPGNTLTGYKGDRPSGRTIFPLRSDSQYCRRSPTLPFHLTESETSHHFGGGTFSTRPPSLCLVHYFCRDPCVYVSRRKDRQLHEFFRDRR